MSIVKSLEEITMLQLAHIVYCTNTQQHGKVEPFLYIHFINCRDQTQQQDNPIVIKS